MTGTDRGFGRYLDESMAARPHTAQDAEVEHNTRGRTTADGTDTTTDDGTEHRPPPTTRRGLGRAGATDRGFGRYLPD